MGRRELGSWSPSLSCAFYKCPHACLTTLLSHQIASLSQGFGGKVGEMMVWKRTALVLMSLAMIGTLYPQEVGNCLVKVEVSELHAVKEEDKKMVNKEIGVEEMDSKLHMHVVEQGLVVLPSRSGCSSECLMFLMGIFWRSWGKPLAWAEVWLCWAARRDCVS